MRRAGLSRVSTQALCVIGTLGKWSKSEQNWSNSEQNLSKSEQNWSKSEQNGSNSEQDWSELVRIGQIRNRIGKIGQNRNDSERFFRKFRIRNEVPIIGTSGNPGKKIKKEVQFLTAIEKFRSLFSSSPHFLSVAICARSPPRNLSYQNLCALPNTTYFYE